MIVLILLLVSLAPARNPGSEPPQFGSSSRRSFGSLGRRTIGPVDQKIFDHRHRQGQGISDTGHRSRPTQGRVLHRGSIDAFKIMYRDERGVWDGIRWDDVVSSESARARSGSIGAFKAPSLEGPDAGRFPVFGWPTPHRCRLDARRAGGCDALGSDIGAFDSSLPGEAM